MNKVDSLIKGVGVVIDDHVFDLISQNAADRCADSFEGKGVVKKDIVAVKTCGVIDLNEYAGSLVSGQELVPARV